MATHTYLDGELVRVSMYDTSLMLTLTDIFPNDKLLSRDFLVKKKDAPKGKIRSLYNTQDNSSLCRKVFRLFMQEVLLDIVSGNCLFKWPGNTQAEMYMGFTKDELVKSKRSKGTLKEFDLFATGYKVPYIKYKHSPKSKRQELCVYLNKPLYKKLIERANTGKVFSKYPKNIYSFLPQIFEQFPYIEEDGLERLIRHCLRLVAWNLRRGEELRILDNSGEIRFFRPLGSIHDKVMTKVKKQRITREKNKK